MRCVALVLCLLATCVNESLSYEYEMLEKGELFTFEYRIFYKNKNDVLVSPFHDISLKDGLDYNMVVEIPRYTNAKMEVATKEALNPIKQDVKNGKLRFVPNEPPFPYNGYIWNYGSFPQTWENSYIKDLFTGEVGDDDPVDVCEIGERIISMGEIVQVKVLAILGLIDEGETDWKVIAIDVNDPNANNINSIDDIEKYKPGLLNATRHWFQISKDVEGKPLNTFAFNGEFRDSNFTKQIISTSHEYWKSLTAGDYPTSENNLTNTQVKESPFNVDEEVALDIFNAVLASSPSSLLVSSFAVIHFIVWLINKV